MKNLIRKFKQMSKKEKIGHTIVYCAIILFLVFLYFFNTSIDKTPLLDENSGDFARARVVEIIEENRDQEGNQIGTQIVNVEILSGDYKGRLYCILPGIAEPVQKAPEFGDCQKLHPPYAGVLQDSSVSSEKL